MFAIVYLKSKNDALESKLKIKEQVMKGLSEELYKLKAEMQIREDARNDTEKKIDELHSGDAVANAISGLSKSKGSRKESSS